METPTAELKTYHGNCHCGAFKFIIKTPEFTTARTCDCSICTQKSYFWVFPKKEDVTVLRGEENLKDYTFGTNQYLHKFCGTCGTAVYCQGVDGGSYGINGRALNDLDVWSVKTTTTDSASREPHYIPPEFNGELPKGEDGDGTKVYTGSCHCGAVRVALRTKPIPECEVKECNCSICMRNGYALIYPTTSQVSITGAGNVTEYRFGRKFCTHHFCKICGIPVYLTMQGPPKEIQDRWSDEVRARMAKNFDLMPVNIKLLQKVEWDQVKITREVDGKDVPPIYQVD